MDTRILFRQRVRQKGIIKQRFTLVCYSYKEATLEVYERKLSQESRILALHNRGATMYVCSEEPLG